MLVFASKSKYIATEMKGGHYADFTYSLVSMLQLRHQPSKKSKYCLSYIHTHVDMLCIELPLPFPLSAFSVTLVLFQGFPLVVQYSTTHWHITCDIAQRFPNTKLEKHKKVQSCWNDLNQGCENQWQLHMGLRFNGRFLLLPYADV